jgi:hypothetical protein
MNPDTTNTRSFRNAFSILKQKRIRLGVKYWWLIVISLLLRWLPFILSTPSSLVDFKRVCIILSCSLLLFALLHNINIWGVRFVTLGTFLNFIAILANLGFMPVSPEAKAQAGEMLLEIPSNGIVLTKSGVVVLPIERTKLWLLTDIIPFPSIHTVLSIGDIVISIGILIVCVSLISRIVRMTPPHIQDSSIKDHKKHA